MRNGNPGLCCVIRAGEVNELPFPCIEKCNLLVENFRWRCDACCGKVPSSLVDKCIERTQKARIGRQNMPIFTLLFLFPPPEHLLSSNNRVALFNIVCCHYAPPEAL